MALPRDAVDDVNLTKRKSKGERSGLCIRSKPYAIASNGCPIEQHVLSNGTGACVSVIDYGAIITEIVVPDCDGQLERDVLGGNSVEYYELLHFPTTRLNPGEAFASTTLYHFSVDSNQSREPSCVR